MSERLVHHSIELFFDDALEEALVASMRRLADAGLPAPLIDWGMRPHVTLALFEHPGDGLCPSVEEFAAQNPSWPVGFNCVGTFGGDEAAVFFVPTVNRTLLDFHARFHAECAAHIEGSNAYYQPGRWMPHCTQSIRITPEQVAETVRVCRDAPLPLVGRYETIGHHVTEIDPAVGVLETSYPYEMSLSG